MYVVGAANVGKSTFINKAVLQMRATGNFAAPDRRLPVVRAHRPRTTPHGRQRFDRLLLRNFVREKCLAFSEVSCAASAGERRVKPSLARHLRPITPVRLW